MIRAVTFMLAALAFVVPAAAQQREMPQSRQQIELSFAPLVKQAAPAVVNVFAEKRPQQVNSPLLNDPVLRRFFGDQLQRRARPSMSLGSGVIVRADGYVITNAHVIRDADDINVVLNDKREFTAKLVLRDDRMDLALLKLEASGLPVLQLKDSDQVETGDMVLAIGNPFGVGQTVTSGIVSAAARSAAGIGDFGFFIQTDAAINPGNSGGALLGMDGKLVGINTAIFSQSGGSIGIGFAIPANIVKTVIEAGEKGEKQVVRPFLGVTAQPVTNEIAQSLNLPRPGGLLVDNVTAGGAAADAGLKRGDVITQINGKDVSDPGELRYRVTLIPVGGKGRMTVVRGGKTEELTFVAKPEALPQDEQLVKQGPLAGVTVATLTPGLADQHGQRVREGVLVLDVAEGSPADQMGLQKDDVILRANNVPVNSTKALAAALQKARGVALTVQRGDQVFQTVVR
ncbi:Do family serine endopeptidase [Roseiterribacter gracilis]|uniref:Serine protease n=1 Tax=Roseiterribacter gracilis TaxID=2812848 RepID=A0A8S8X7N0_9PROT|nr:serine protease [Rhodospirillales bacterium TMPK1]